MSFDSKNIKDPYKFIDALYSRLSGAYKDVEVRIQQDYYFKDFATFREQDILHSIISWIEKYED